MSSVTEENREEKNPLGTEKEGKLLVNFAIPCIISMLVSALYNIVDQIFIGQGVGMLGNAATNIAFPLSTTCTAIALLLGIGGAVVGIGVLLSLIPVLRSNPKDILSRMEG